MPGADDRDWEALRGKEAGPPTDLGCKPGPARETPMPCLAPHLGLEACCFSERPGPALGGRRTAGNVSVHCSFPTPLGAGWSALGEGMGGWGT